MTKILTDDERRAVEDAANEADVEIREEYGGRGMYGRKCFGVVGSGSQFNRFLVELAIEDELGYMLARDLASAAEDSMGHQRIYYWSNIQWCEPAEGGADDGE